MESSKLEAWISLSLMSGISHKIFHQLLSAFGEPERLLSNNHPEFLAPQNNPPESNQSENEQDFQALLAGCRLQLRNKALRKKVQRALDWQQEEDQHILTLHCAEYPELLKEISDPPPILYVKGSPAVLTFPQIAMVGSRNASPGGKAIARRLASDLAGGGYSVCSGMALGIDAESHLGALDSQGISVAVLGCGVDQIYPRQNKKLAGRLVEAGAIVSEFALGAAPESWHFPQRNRLISGLSHGVVVVEAALRSGSLITARFALEQGREVFAVPGSPHNPLAKGCHLLLKNGAKLVEQASDIVEELGAFLNLQHAQLGSSALKSEPLSKDATKLLQHIDYEATSIDYLVYQTGMRAELIGSLLVGLELQGHIICRAGGYSLSPAGA
tara:strand:+ start:74987 stop:76144 length:1158 start_codon:yes stop_codon:yes gene_type:complete